MNTIIEKIRAEVNRLKKQLVRGACAAQIQMETSCKDEAYDEMLSILSDLEKEENPIEGLEEEIKRFQKEVWDYDTTLSDVARHFAKWQKEQMMKNGNVILSEEDFDAEKEKSMERGYNLCKEQMMKGAAEGMIDYVYDEKGDAYKAIRLDWLVGDFGDKVKLIIVKED